MNEYVRKTPELTRILALPRRRVDDPQWEHLADELTELLKTPHGTMRLRPAQALALYEIATLRGGICPVEVGGGKTLISLLAANVLEAKRPLLLLPANLIEKTNRDRAELARDWQIPTNIRLFSYEMLGRVQSAGELDHYLPDVVIADELHKLKNPDAAVTRRVARDLEARPDVIFVGLSGTFMDRSVRETAHPLRWALKDNAPIPKTEGETDEWAAALDEKVDELRRFEPGALLELATDEDADPSPLVTARRGFRRRLVETPGIVSTIGNGEHVDCSIIVKAITYAVAPITNEHIAKLRNEMETPDGWELTQPVDVWRHARELALGFHQIWDPRPPEEWRSARRGWFSFVREVLSRSRTLDSPEHVANAVDDGRLPEGGDPLATWRGIRDTFIPNAIPIWHDESALRVAAAWMKRPGIVWVDHVPFGERLSEITGAPYYAEGGLDPGGAFIDDGDPKRAVIASVKANKEGRNLQKKWARSLVTSPQEGPGLWQQLIGRTHRPGQLADEVEVDVFLGCAEHTDAWRKALAGAAAVRDTTGAQQKLLIANVATWPSDLEIANYSGARWKRTPETKPFQIPI